MMSVFRRFPKANGDRHNSCMTLGRYTTQLMAFLRRIRKLLQKIETGESLLLPAIV